MKLNQWLLQVISGGQTGADTAGLEAAKRCGILTGGYMPKGFKREDGDAPHFQELYGVRESGDPSYPFRTEMNVRHSDGTLQIAGIWGSPGEKLTTNLAVRFGKQLYQLEPKALNNRIRPWNRSAQMIVSPKDVADWIVAHKCKTLNIAGNSESTWIGMYDWALRFLLEVFQQEL